MNAISPSEKWARWITGLCALAAGLASFFPILLLIFDSGNSWFSCLRPCLSLAPCTACLLTLLSIALFVYNAWPQRRLGRFFTGLVVAIVSTASLLAIVRLFFPIHIELEVSILNLVRNPSQNSAGHLSLPAAAILLCAAWALGCLLTSSKPMAQWRARMAFLLAAMVLGGAYITALGFAAGTPPLYDPGHPPMLWLPPVILVLLAAGLMLAAIPNNWLLQALTGEAATVPNPLSLRFRRALIIALGFFSAGILFAGLYLLRAEQKTLGKQVEKELTAIASLKAKSIAEWRRNLLNEANIIFHTPYGARRALDALAAPSSPATRDKYAAWLNRFFALGNFSEVVLLDAQLNVGLVHPPRSDIVLSQPEMAQARHALGTRALTFTDLYRPDEDTNAVRFGIMVPIIVRREGTTNKVISAGTPASAADRGAAVLVLRVDARKTLFPLVQTWPVQSRSAETLLVRREGGEGIYLSDLRFKPRAALWLRFPVAGTNSPPAMAVRGNESVFMGIDYRGASVMAATRIVPDSPWSIVAKMDESEIFAPLYKLGAVAGTILLTLISILGLSFNLLWRRREAEILQSQIANEHARLVLAERLNHLMRQANDIISITDDQWRILEMNDRGLKQYGYSLAELQKMRAMDLRAPQVQSAFPVFEEQFQSRGEAVLETVHQRKDGSTFPVEVSIRKVQTDGKPHSVAVIRDISQRKQAENALLESEARYRSLVEAAEDTIVTISLDGRFTLLSPAFEANTGLKREEWLGRNFAELLHPEDLPKVQAELTNVASGKHPPLFDVRVRKQAGDYLTVQILATPQWRAGSVDSVLVIARDVTAIRQMQEALTSQEARLRMALEGAGMVTWEWDVRAGTIRYSDNVASVAHGKATAPYCSADGLLQEVHPEDRERLTQVINRTVTEDAPFECDYRVRMLDGNYHWILGKGKAVVAEGGKPVRLLGISMDITERKRAEDTIHRLNESLEQRIRERTAELTTTTEALRESEGRHRALFEGAPLGILVADVQTKIFHYANPAICRMLGYTAAELTGLALNDLIPSESLPRIIAQFEAQARWENRVAQNIPCRRKDGTVFFADVAATPLVIDGRNQLVGFFSDITDREQAEQALRASEARNRLLSENTFEGIVIHENAWIVDCNRSFAQMFGYEPSELLGSDGLQLVTPDSREIVASHFQNEASGPYEVTGLRKDGSTFPLELQARMFLLGERKVRFGSCRDITERKQAEEKIRELNASLEQRVWERTAQLAVANEQLRLSELQLKQAAHAGNVGLWDWDLATNRVFFSPEWKQQIGCEDHEISNDFNEWQSRVHPDDLEATLEKVRAASEKPWPKLKVEFRFRHKDGSYRWILSQASILSGNGGKTQHLLGSHVDITDLKHLQEQLLEVSDREQARFGQDLHDGLSQLLVSAAFDLTRLEKRVAVSTPDVLALARQARDTIDAAITQARGVARGLFAVQLGGEGLPHALRDLAATVSARHPIACKVHCPNSVPITDNTAATHLFRIAQEAVINAVKHAKPSRIEIQLAVKAGQINLTVTDDGSGFAPERRRRTGMGLHIMDYRTRALKGTFKIERAPTKGTRVSCSLPTTHPNKTGL